MGLTGGDEPTDLTQLGTQADNQIERQSCSAKPFIRKRAVPAMGIDDGHCGRQLIRWLMVIDHNDIEPKVSRRIDFSGIRNTAIHCHYQARPTLSQAPEPFDVQAVSFLDPMGNMIDRLRADLS